jgi:phospholipid transport system transporter-binding protein
MNKVKLEKTSACEAHLSGELGFSTVTALVSQIDTQLDECQQLNIDLAGVTRADSAGVTLLVEWMRKAHAQNKDIRFINIPRQMLSILRVSSLEGILPIVMQ